MRRGLHRNARRLLSALALAAWVAGCGSADRASSRAEVAELRLPRGAYPSHLLLARDGSLWITESAEAVARRLPSGRVRQYRLPGDENSPGDLEEGPDGAIWIVGFEEFIRIDPGDGSVGIAAGFGPNANPEVGLPVAVANGPDGRAWFATEGAYAAILRVDSGGEIDSLSVEAELGEMDVAGAVLGPDRAVWMTLREEFGGSRCEIVRLSEDGHLRRWMLPDGRSDLGQIVLGPDGAMWFTEPSDHRIGRITVEGQIAEFPLRPGLSPNDIAASPKGALWFTTEKRIGRVTTDGKVRTWLVPNADYLFGVAPAADGGAWVADGPADMVHHVESPL
jgi:virginiamycin B lyase